MASGRERTRKRESIAQRPQRSQRGIEAWRRKAFWWTAWLLGGKGREKGKASHRGHRGHRGGLRLGGARLFRGQHGFWAGKDAKKGKHRTEATEVTEGD